jgi:hypothetical protein
MEGPETKIDHESTNSVKTTTIQEMTREMDSGTTNVVHQNKEMVLETITEHMEQETGGGVGEEDHSSETMDTTEVQVVENESSIMPQIGKGEEKIDSPPYSNVGSVETETHSEEKREENASNKRLAGKKMHQHSDDTEEKETKPEDKDEYPALQTLTDDEQETVRPPHIRKKKPRTDIDVTVERRESRSSRYRRI